MFLLTASFGGGNFKIFHLEHHTWKNNNQIANYGNFEHLYLSNPQWSRQSANLGFLYESISIRIYRSHFGHMNFFVCSTVYWLASVLEMGRILICNHSPGMIPLNYSLLIMFRSMILDWGGIRRRIWYEISSGLRVVFFSTWMTLSNSMKEMGRNMN